MTEYGLVVSTEVDKILRSVNTNKINARNGFSYPCGRFVVL